MNKPSVEVDLRPYFRGEARGTHRKSLVVLHETVSHDAPGVSDIRGVASYMDAHGLEVHLIIDRERNSGWCYKTDAIYDHTASAGGNVNTRAVGIELISDIPMLTSNAARRAAWDDPRRRAQLDKAAEWIAWLSTVRPIPLRYSAGDRPGVTTHWHVSKTYLGGSGHWDCWPRHAPHGGYFPALYVVSKARQLVAAVGA